MVTVTSPRFIGRKAERTLLEKTIAASRSGSGQAVLLIGEAGIGKSRLLAEVTDRARANGHRVLAGGCVSLRDDAAPLAPVAEAIRSLAAEIAPRELDRLLGPAHEVLAGLLPGLVERAPRQSGAGLMHASVQDRLFFHLLDLMTRLSHDAPLVLVIEDIHWADSATLELLRLVVRNLRNSAFTMIATYRSDEPDPDRRLTSFVAELERAVHPEHIVLRRFTRGEVTEQIAAIRGAAAATFELIDDVWSRSDGNPFYVEELLAVAEADIEDAMGELPVTFGDVLQARLASVSATAGEIVAAAAVRGRESTEDELAVVTDLEESSFAAGLHELLERKIFDRRRMGGREVMDFRHALLRSAAYDDLLSRERRRLHLAYAGMLESRTGTGDDPFALAELARHWEAAGDLERAYSAALTAAAAADAAYSPALASEQYERALRLARSTVGAGQGSVLDEISLLERAARAAAAIGSSRAIEHVTRALQLVDPRTDPVRAGMLYERLGRYRWYAADGEGALAAYREAVRLVPTEPPSAARARVTAGLAQLLMLLARFEESMALCTEAIASARAVGDRATEGHVSNTLGVNTAELGDTDTGLQLLWASKATADEVGSVEDVSRAYVNLVHVLRVAGRYEDAADLGRESYSYIQSHGLGAVYGVAVVNYYAWGLHRLARWTEALAALEEGRRYPMAANTEIVNLAVSAMIEACRGESELAESHLEIARALIASAIDTQLLLPFAEAEAELAIWTNRPYAALDAVMDGLERVQPLAAGNISRYGPVYALGLRAASDIVSLSAVDQRAAETAREAATRWLKAMEDARREIRVHHPALVPLAAPYLALCRAEHTRLEQKSDPQAWATAAEQLSGLDLRHLIAYAQWRQAEASLQAAGNPSDAREPLVAAHRTAVGIGAEPLRRAIEDLARRSRVELETPTRDRRAKDARFGLTPREIEVLRLLAAGKTNRQIGAELFISHKTASVHVSNVLAKLGASRRSEAAALATRMGLVEDERAPADGQ